MDKLLEELAEVVAARVAWIESSTDAAWNELALLAVDLASAHHAEIAEAVADARRYRWLRDRLAGADHVRELVEYNHDMHPEIRVEIDAAIDAHHNIAREGE